MSGPTEAGRYEWTGSQLVITHCIHGLDLRLYARCYLCQPADVVPSRDAYIAADFDEQGIIIDALSVAHAEAASRALANRSGASAERAEICKRLIRRIVGADQP